MAKKTKKAAYSDPRDTDLDLGSLIDFVNEHDDGTVDSRERSEKCRDYYDSKQWTDSEIAVLKKRKQAAVVVNRIKPKMDGLMGMEKSNRTTAKAYPRTPKHEQDAQAATEAIRYVLDDNSWRSVRSSAWDNLCLEGTGGVEIIVDPDEFDIRINHIPWDRLIYDVFDRSKGFRNPRFLGQHMWLDYDIALEKFPEGKEVLETLFNGSSTFDDKPRWLDTKRRRCKVVELYYLKDGDWWYACFTRGGFLKNPKKSPYVTETGETEHPYEFASLFVDLEGNRYGAALQYLDVQDEINKRRSKALHLMSVRQVRWERGAVEDINKAREELAKPDGVVETTPGMEFEVLKTGDMAQAQFKLLEDAKTEIDNVGYSAAASGKEERLMSGVALRNREAASQTELAPMFDVLKDLDIRVFRKVWNRVKQYWSEETWIRVTDDPANLKWVALNRRMTRGQLVLEQAKAQNAPPEQLAQLEQQIAMDPSAQEPITQNDVAQMDVDIVIDDAPDSITMQQEQFTALSEMVKSGIPIPPTAIIEASDLKNKDRILKEMREGMALPPEMQEKLQKQQEEFQALQQENQQLKADQSTEMAKIQAQQQAKAAELQGNQQMKAAELQQNAAMSQQEFEHQRQAQEREFQLQREKQQHDIQLAREKAEAEAAIKLITAKTDAELRERELQTTAAQGDKKIALDAEQKKRETDIKVAEQQRADSETAMPQFMKAMEAMVKSVQALVEQNGKAMEKVAKALEKSAGQKKISLDIERDSDGMLVGGSATVQ